ncbi:MAG TPA: lactoylglutathione lyase [Alphaproteobacteria bacterium]|nr:lactoylglutathione lyase [Alphaproteobacteria bacterium]
MIRVKDLDKSVKFYEQVLGMTVQKRLDFETGRFTLVFIGYGSLHSQTVLELTHNWDNTEDYTHGSGYGHIAIKTDNMFEICKKAEQFGGIVTRPAGPMTGTDINMAFITDPDGYKVELLETTENLS